MLYIYFWKLFNLLMFFNINRTNGSLLSRFRNPNEYVPRDAGKYFFPEDIDDDLYADLLLEVPELAGKLRVNQNDMEENIIKENTMLPFIRHDVNGSFEVIKNMEEFDTVKDEDQEEYPGQLDYMTVTENIKNNTSSRRLPYLTRWPLNRSEQLASRRQNMKPDRWFWSSWFYPRVATCYWCGMNHSTKIPLSPLCHDAFESPDWRARTMARYFRVHCHKSWWVSSDIKSYSFDSWTTYRYDNGLIRRWYGSYRGGCFKRFLDVGKVYTQRGCRSWWPKYSSANFATHRFTRLEALLHRKSDYCIVSPHASLTPFSRGISLYVRYHVCVCDKRYCNISTRLQYTFSLTIATILLSYFISF